MEREILRVCCTGAAPRSERENAQMRLARYKWQEPDHAVIYEALVRAERVGADALREYLPAQVTRMGFPDIDWAIFFAEKPLSETLDVLLDKLDAAAGGG